MDFAPHFFVEIAIILFVAYVSYALGKSDLRLHPALTAVTVVVAVILHGIWQLALPHEGIDSSPGLSPGYRSRSIWWQSHSLRPQESGLRFWPFTGPRCEPGSGRPDISSVLRRSALLVITRRSIRRWSLTRITPFGLGLRWSLRRFLSQSAALSRGGSGPSRLRSRRPRRLTAIDRV